jgi:pimeloyl-ACP methyl ester carboxylesterase
MDDAQAFGIDLPGHGKSAGDGESSVIDYVGHIVHWMDALEIPHAIWCGHSMGGAIAMTAALEFPSRVSGLILVGTGARLRVSPDILKITADPDRYPEAAELISEWAFSPSASTRLKELGRARYGNGRPEVMHNDFAACDRFDIMDRVGELNSPALIICGEDDQLTPVKYSRYLADHIPDAQIKLIPGAGHMVMLEKPGEVEAEIRGFLMRL